MLLALGPHQFDITHRAIVMGVVDQPPGLGLDDLLQDAERMVDQGAHALTIGWTGADSDDRAGFHETDELAAAVVALRARFDQPLVVRTRRTSAARASIDAGAVAAHDDSISGDADYLAAVASAGASVVIGGTGRSDEVARSLTGRAWDARAAGLADGQIVLDSGVDRSPSPADGLEQLRNHDCIARLGWPVLLSATGDRVTSIATFATGVVRGARVLRTRDVRMARRVAEVGARLLGARAAFEDLQEVP